MPEHVERPLLAVDVDGVVSLFGFDDPTEPGGGAAAGGAMGVKPPCEFHLIDGVAHCISREAGDRLRRLSEWYDLVWATGWEERANDYLPGLLGLPGELPYLTFDGQARFGSAHWKVDAISDYAGDRPVAWIDDCIDESCRFWAHMRDGPTLLVPVDPRRGLEEAHTEALITWVQGGYTP